MVVKIQAWELKVLNRFNDFDEDDFELPPDYVPTPPERKKAAHPFFARAESIGEMRQFDYGIELYLQGLQIDPENVRAHQQLRELSTQRKADGRKDLHSFAKFQLVFDRAQVPQQNMLNAEKLLAYDPGNTFHMLIIQECALKAGCHKAAQWITKILDASRS